MACRTLGWREVEEWSLGLQDTPPPSIPDTTSPPNPELIYSSLRPFLVPHQNLPVIPPLRRPRALAPLPQPVPGERDRET